MSYPWRDGELLTAADLNAALAGRIGPPGSPGSPGVMILTGGGPPAGDAAEGTTYFDLSNGDVWQFGAPAVVPYHAGAVRFADGAYLLCLPALAAPISGLFSFSYWQKADPIEGNVFFWSLGGALQGDIRSPGNPVGKTDYYLESPDGNSYLDVLTGNYDKTAWHHFLGSFDTSHAGTAKLGVLYIDDALSMGIDADGPAFIMNMAVRVTVGNGLIADMADVRLMPGFSLLDGAGNIPEATRRLFIDAAGKPVDPAVATAALGAPCILFSGDVVSFVTNQGTGGAFTVQSTLTDATTSPSD